MRKVGACVAAMLGAAIAFSPLQAAAFGLRVGPFHIGIPLYLPHFHRHRLYMHANRGDVAHSERRSEPGPAVTSALLYPNLALAGVFQDVFFPGNAPAWPFSYERIFSTAFVHLPGSEDRRLCQPSFDANAVVARLRSEVAPTPDQEPSLQKLGGALGAAAGFLAKACPSDIPAQPVARLQLMESQIEELSMAVDIARAPLQEFEQSLSDQQKAKLAGSAAPAAGSDRLDQTAAIGSSCEGSATPIDRTIHQIDGTVQPTGTQRPALADVKKAFAKAADDLEAHCPTTLAPTAVARLEAAEARLDATWRSILSTQVALANFQSKLDEAQKDRLDQMNFVAAR
jgi:hypothetical protein